MNRRQDSWNANLYENHAYVWHYGTDLVDLLAPQPGERILDLGCGTGQLTAQIAEAGAVAIGIDNSSEMIACAQEKYPDLEFLMANGANFRFSEQFDAVFSNAALHWLKPPESVIACIWQALKPKGRFVAEFGGRGNIQSIITGINAARQEHGYREVGNPWYFPSIANYATLLEKQGLEVLYAKLFDRPTQLEGEGGISNWIVMFGNRLLADIPPEHKIRIIQTVAEKVRPKLYREGTWWADYRRLRIIAQTPDEL